jgi:hypothetical protein
MVALRRILIVATLLILSAGLVGGASAYPGNLLYFPETGFEISGDFETFYNNNADPLFYLGYPISVEIITNPLTGESSQYFQRARLDRKFDNGEWKVTIANLGTYLDHKGTTAELPTSAPCRIFSNGKRVCYAFQQFYDSNRGEEFFGLPKSELLIESGRLVQYFEKARMEWRPEIPGNTHVVLSDIGKIYIDTQHIDPYDSTPDDGIPYAVPNNGPLSVRVFTSEAASIPGNMQTIFVIVQNGSLAGVPAANVTVILVYQDGSEQKLPPGATNQNGIFQVSFKVSPSLLSEQIVQIKVYANKGNSTGSGQGWFRIRQ